MEEDPLQQASGTVDERLASARDLLFRRRYRDALDLINSVVLVSPSNPRAFLIRAAAFEGMDLIPQADADIAHTRQLCEQQGADFDALVDELNTPPPKAKGKGKERAERPPPPPRRQSRGAGAVEYAIIFVFILFLGAAVAAGTYIVIGSLDINNDDTNGGAAAANPTPTPITGETAAPTVSTTPEASRTPTRTPAASLPPGVDGDPYSLSSVEVAWEAEGMTVTGGSAATGFSGFSIAPTSVTVSRTGTSADTAVFVYEDATAPAQDWTLVIGERPAPKPGRTVPSHFTIYWNTNVVIVVLDDPSALGADLLDGILNMAP